MFSLPYCFILLYFFSELFVSFHSQLCCGLTDNLADSRDWVPFPGGPIKPSFAPGFFFRKAPFCGLISTDASLPMAANEVTSLCFTATPWGPMNEARRFFRQDVVSHPSVGNSTGNPCRGCRLQFPLRVCGSFQIHGKCRRGCRPRSVFRTLLDQLMCRSPTCRSVQ